MALMDGVAKPGGVTRGTSEDGDDSVDKCVAVYYMV